MAHLTFHSSCRPTFQAENPRIFLYEAIFWQKLSWPQLGIKSVTETLKLFEIPHEDRKFMINKDQDYAKKSPIAKKNHVRMVMECQGVAVDSRAWVAAAECHLEGIIWEEKDFVSLVCLAGAPI